MFEMFHLSLSLAVLSLPSAVTLLSRKQIARSKPLRFSAHTHSKALPQRDCQ